MSVSWGVSLFIQRFVVLVQKQSRQLCNAQDSFNTLQRCLWSLTVREQG